MIIEKDKPIATIEIDKLTVTIDTLDTNCALKVVNDGECLSLDTERLKSLNQTLEQLITQNLIFKISAVVLKGLGINTIPDKIHQLACLEYIDLSNNLFTEVPNLYHFKQLSRIDLSTNNINSLSDNIVESLNLKKVQYLSFVDNMIELSNIAVCLSIVLKVTFTINHSVQQALFNQKQRQIKQSFKYLCKESLAATWTLKSYLESQSTISLSFDEIVILLLGKLSKVDTGNLDRDIGHLRSVICDSPLCSLTIKKQLRFTPKKNPNITIPTSNIVAKTI